MNLFFARPKIRKIWNIGGLTNDRVYVGCMLISNLSEAMGFKTVTNVVSSEKRFVFQDLTTIKVVAWFITDSARKCNIITSWGLLDRIDVGRISVA